MAIPLLESYLDNGIRVPHFFNGRILDADALQTEQTAHRQQHRQLGTAVGSGVAWGFTVEIEKSGTVSESPILRVSEGVAINRAGQTIELRLSPRPDDCAANNATATPLAALSVILAKGDKPPVPNVGCFALCDVPTTSLPQVEGVFILTVSPASGFQGRAPMKSLSTTGKNAGCGSRYEVEGVTFRLVGCPPLPAALADVLSNGTDNPQTLQNRVAHWCYGSTELLDYSNYPFGFPSSYGALDALRLSKQLDDCDVPLALIYWSGNTVRFCDMWAVRRSLAPVLPAEMFPVAVGQRRIAESVAQFLQFQNQIAAVPIGSRRNLDAKSQFRFLPATGYLPLGGQNFDEVAFFTQFFASPTPPLRYSLDPAWVRLLLSQSWLLDPIDLNANPLPPLTLYLLGASGEENYLLFARQSISTSLELKTETAAETPTAPAPTEGKKPGRIFVTVMFRANAEEIRLGMKKMAVTATDELGTKYKGQLYNKKAELDSRDFFNSIRGDNEEQIYVFAKLEAGRYTVKTQAVGFAADTQNIDLDAGESVKIEAVLIRSKKQTEEPPKDTPPEVRGGWVDAKYGEIIPLDKYLKWKDDPPFENYKILDPPLDIINKYRDMAEGLQKRFPDAPISPSDIQVYVDPLYDPANVAQDFYAYLRMGQAYLPILLVATDLQTDKALSIGDSQIGGIDSGMLGKLAENGIATINALSATPTKLLSEILDFNTGASESLVTSAREGISKLKESPLMIAGVTEANAKTLTENGFDSVTKLAEAEPPAVATTLGVTEAVAERMVDEAKGIVKGRSTVTEVAGITQELATKFEAIGVTTIRDMSTLTRDDITTNLGITNEAADSMLNNMHGMIGLGAINR